MDADEYQHSTAELKALYITYGLEPRRKKFYEKMGYATHIYTTRTQINI